ncbi:DsbA family protein [Nonomuraea sp. NPDC050790]|uniref:DsbA family protein n=1 Tax=Nonomuraea sp. NPDC050790 TaxID=3364371 RepID=UPI0037B5E16B
MNKRLVAAGVAACVVLAVLAVVAFSEPSGNQGAYQLTRQPDGSMVLARPGVTAPVLDLYEDFDCPVCKQLHAAVDPTIQRLAKAGSVKVVFHPVTIFRDEPMRSNSVRAAAAARCVPAANWLAFRDQLYAIQPAPHGTASGFTPEELVGAARKAGASVDECVSTQTFAGQHLSENAGPRLDGTPTVLFNGQMLGDVAFDAKALEQLITGGDGVSI